MLYHAYVDHRDHRPPTPPRPLSRTERKRMAHERFESRRHPDAAARAVLLVDIDEEIDRRDMLRADATSAMRLAAGSLDDQSLSTDQLRAALNVIRGLPTP